MNEPCASYYHRYRFPAEIIVVAVWLYFRCTVSFRMVEDMLAYRGIIVSHKTIREWVEKFVRDYANKIRRRTPLLGDKWHLDECVISIKGDEHILWRAVDQDGFVIEVLLQNAIIPSLPSALFANFCPARAAHRV